MRKVPQPLDATALRNAKSALRFGRGLSAGSDALQLLPVPGDFHDAHAVDLRDAGLDRPHALRAILPSEQCCRRIGVDCQQPRQTNHIERARTQRGFNTCGCAEAASHHQRRRHQAPHLFGELKEVGFARCRGCLLRLGDNTAHGGGFIGAARDLDQIDACVGESNDCLNRLLLAEASTLEIGGVELDANGKITVPSYQFSW